MTESLVLAVDDDAGILKVVELTLLSAGYSVIGFDNPLDALDELQEGLRPDVIVSDVSMPGLTGFEFFREVRKISELTAVPFLFLTALEDRSYVRQGMTLGADDYLTKPFGRQELTEAVGVRLQRISELRQPIEGVVSARGLGHPGVRQNGKRLDWDSVKVLELLFYFLENRGGVTTFEVAEALWPGKTEARSSSSFHTTLYRLRRAMGGEVVESANRRYYFHDGFRIEYDVERYRAASARARESEELTVIEGAVALYGGSFMTGFDGEWIEEVRVSLHNEHFSLLELGLAGARSAGDLEGATRWSQLMTEHEPYSEGAWEELASLWEERGEPAMARAARERFEQLMLAD